MESRERQNHPHSFGQQAPTQATNYANQQFQAQALPEYPMTVTVNSQAYSYVASKSSHEHFYVHQTLAHYIMVRTDKGGGGNSFMTKDSYYMTKIQRCQGFHTPIFYGEGYFQQKPYLKLEYLPLTVEEYLTNLGQITLPQLVQIGTEMLESLRELHQHGFLFNSINPNNFRVNLECQIKLIDYSRTTEYHANGRHRQRNAYGFQGEPYFASVRALQGFTVSRRDELESLAYVMMYLIDKESIPWLQLTSTRDIASMKQRFIENSKDCPPQFKGLHPFLWRAYSLGFKEEPDYDEFKYLLTFLVPRDPFPPGLNQSLEVMLQRTANNVLLEQIDQQNKDFQTINKKLRENKLKRVLIIVMKKESEQILNQARNSLQSLRTHMYEQRKQAQLLEDTLEKASQQIYKIVEIEMIEDSTLKIASSMSKVIEDKERRKGEMKEEVKNETIQSPNKIIAQEVQQETSYEKLEEVKQEIIEKMPQDNQITIQSRLNDFIDLLSCSDTQALVLEALSHVEDERNVYKKAIRQLILSGFKLKPCQDQNAYQIDKDQCIPFEQTLEAEFNICNDNDVNKSEEEYVKISDDHRTELTEEQTILMQGQLSDVQEQKLHLYFIQGGLSANFDSSIVSLRNYGFLDANSKVYLHKKIFCQKPIPQYFQNFDLMTRTLFLRSYKKNGAAGAIQLLQQQKIHDESFSTLGESTGSLMSTRLFRNSALFFEQQNDLVNLEMKLSFIKMQHGLIKFDEIQRYLFSNFQEYKEIVKMNNNKDLQQDIDAVIAFFRSPIFCNNPQSASFKVSLISKSIISIKDAVHSVLKEDMDKPLIQKKRRFHIIINSTDTLDEYLQNDQGSIIKNFISKKYPHNISYIILTISKIVKGDKKERVKNLLFEKVTGSGEGGKRYEWQVFSELESADYYLGIDVAYSYDNGAQVCLEEVKNPKDIFIRYLPSQSQTLINLNGNTLTL
ncbi:hypothetical protein FGO68_gene5006 [Halteria grandinella]|uniref:Casein kinase I n=1 Tax=Halteria grandinella TaxID=5974 RepID=A0A8J8T756_HALGN|nr:hypothetical protein FGO68_gene5006 [Halteria grandinella]